MHNLDCLRKDFEETLTVNNLNCTLPWIESMRGRLHYIEAEKPTCDTLEDYNLADEVSWNFAISASAFSRQKCLVLIQKSLIRYLIQNKLMFLKVSISF